MFIPKELMAAQHAKLKQGTTVGYQGQNLVVTQRGLTSVSELNPHPAGAYTQTHRDGKPYFKPGSWT